MSTTDKSARNAELMRLAEKATPGPWSVYKQLDGQVRLEDDDEGPIAYLSQGEHEKQRNGVFIAAAREHLADLVRENEEMAQRERIYDAFMGNVEKALKDRDTAMLMAAIQAAHSAFRQVKP